MKDVARVRSSQPLGPEPYAGGGNTPGVAWGMGTCRPAIELRNQPFRVPTLSNCGEGNTQQRALASGAVTRRSRRPWACMETPNARTERSHAFPLHGGTGGEDHRSHVHHERAWEVRWSHSTYEVGEQNRNPGGGACGGKGITQGKVAQHGSLRTLCRARRGSLREATAGRDCHLDRYTQGRSRMR
jgi:hypothetical protein